VFLFAESSPTPQFVVKIALSELESRYLTQEFVALESVHAVLPPNLASRVPAPLTLLNIEGSTALVCSPVIGRRLLIPMLTSKHSVMGRRVLRDFFQQAFSFSQDLAMAGVAANSSSSTSLFEIVAKFRDRFGGLGEAGPELVAFEREVLNTPIISKPTLQHCDMMISNVLKNGPELRVLDWEHSRLNSHSWFDIAYAPIALVLMASWQSGRQLQDVATHILNERSWPGRILSAEMERVWKFPLPLSWGVLLTAMETAVRQEVEGRTAAGDWSGFVHTILGKRGKREVPWLSRW
jgi:hypothetical protein